MLQKLDLNITDDWTNVGKDGTVSWILAFRDWKKYYGPVELKDDSFEHVIHQVRNPLDSITSMACTEPFEAKEYREFIARKIDIRSLEKLPANEITDNDQFLMALMMWVQWHEFLDEVSEYTFQMETTNVDTVKEIVKICGFEIDESHYDELESEFGKVKNARKHRKRISWNQLRYADEKFATRAMKLAIKYGYENVSTWNNWKNKNIEIEPSEALRC